MRIDLWDKEKKAGRYGRERFGKVVRWLAPRSNGILSPCFHLFFLSVFVRQTLTVAGPRMWGRGGYAKKQQAAAAAVPGPSE